MIKNQKPLSMVKVLKYVKKDKELGGELAGFIKKFTKIDAKKAQELKENLFGLDLINMKEDHIINIIDVMPENPEYLNKIFVGISLDEDEKGKILETIKGFK